jgi:hypothetical protein
MGLNDPISKSDIEMAKQLVVQELLTIREHSLEKGVIRSRQPRKDRQCNGQKKQDKRRNNTLQKTIQKTKD